MTIICKNPLIALLFFAVVNFLVQPCISTGLRGGGEGEGGHLLEETFRPSNDNSTAAAEWNRGMLSRTISCVNQVDRMRIIDDQEVSPTAVGSVQTSILSIEVSRRSEDRCRLRCLRR